ncbi:MAG: alpha/beta fold hydrolase [Candidatus Bathyarchaeia archaeon]
MAIQPREDFIESGGFRLHYLMWGQEGPPIVILHSMGMDAHGFDTFSRAVSKDYRVLAITILGHGDSDKPARPVGLEEHAGIIRQAYTELGFESPVLIGHSVGGMLGMVLAARYPEEIRGLVLVDIAPFDMAQISRKRPPRPEPPESFADEGEARAFLRERYPRFTDEAYDNRINHAFKRDADGRLRFKGLGDTIRPSLTIDLWPFVEKMKTPTLLLAAGEGHIVTPPAVSHMRSLLPDFEVKAVEGATHMIPQDRPAEFEVAVREFLSKIYG